MNPADLVPATGAIPVPWGWFQFLLILTFTAHVLIMNTALGAAIIAFVNSLVGLDTKSPTAKEISTKLPTTLALTVNFGVAPLLFLQVLYGHLFYIGDILMAFFWLSVVFLVITAYYCAYIYDFKFDALGGRRILVMGLCASSLLAVGFFFTNNMTFLMTPGTWEAWFDAPHGFLLNTDEPTLFPRYLHFVTSSVAVGGLALALLWTRRARLAGEGSEGEAGAMAQAMTGMRWFAAASTLQLGVGVWFLLALPREVMLMFMGGYTLHTVLFVIGLAGALAVIVLGWMGAVVPSLAALLVTVVSMVGMRELVRVAYLKPYYSAASLEVEPQYASMIMFFVALAVGLVVMGYVLKLAAQAKEEA